MDQLENTNVRPFIPKTGQLILGRYHIESCLGKGGMGTVFLARDEAVASSRVALKVLHAHLASRAAFVSRLRNEVIVTRKLDHPHIVRTFMLDFREDDVPFLIMEYVNGTSLADFLRGQQEQRLRPARQSAFCSRPPQHWHTPTIWA